MVNLIRGVRGNTLRLKVERGDHVVPNIQVITKNKYVGPFPSPYNVLKRQETIKDNKPKMMIFVEFFRFQVFQPNLEKEYNHGGKSNFVP